MVAPSGVLPVPWLPAGAATLSFTVTEDNAKFRCFASGCDASGNGVDFVARLEASTRFVMQPSWSRAILARNAHASESRATAEHRASRYPWLPSLGTWAAKSQRASGEGEHGNQPLSWQHEKLDYEHPYLLKTRVLVEISSVSLASGTIRARA